MKWIAELFKIRITVFVTLSTSSGYVLSGGSDAASFLFTLAGVFLLACGAAGLNQIQEYKLDRLMERTKSRPLASGKAGYGAALALSIAAAILGFAVLITVDGIVCGLLGLFALVWYNGFYTPLKRKTALAVFPGALIGAVSPAIGWFAGGGRADNPQIWALSLFFFIWQVPHFWLLMLAYEKDYERAGFPTLGKIFGRLQALRITSVWTASLAVSGILVPMFSEKKIITGLLLFAAGILLYIEIRKALSGKYALNNGEKRAFAKINAYMLISALVLITSKLLNF